MATTAINDLVLYRAARDLVMRWSATWTYVSTAPRFADPRMVSRRVAAQDIAGLRKAIPVSCRPQMAAYLRQHMRDSRAVRHG